MNRYVTALATTLLLQSPLHAQEYDVIPTVILSNLAEEARVERQLGSSLAALAGGLLFMFSSDIADEIQENEDFDHWERKDTKAVLHLTSAALMVGGVLGWRVSSGPEKAWTRVSLMPDDVDRESVAYTAIFDLASKKKTERLLSGIASLGVAAYLFNRADEEDDEAFEYHGWFMVASGFGNLIIPSREERAMHKLDKKPKGGKRRSWRDNLGFGVTFNPGVGPQLALNMKY